MKLLILDENYQGRLKNLTSQFRGGDVVVSKLDGFYLRDRQLRQGSDLRIAHAHATLEQLPSLMPGVDADVVLFVPSWRHSGEELLATLSEISVASSRVALGLFDTYDQTSSPHLLSLPFVDFYLKSQVLRDRSRYADPIAGGFVFAEWVQNNLGFDLGDWNFGSIIPRGFEDRLACGWNMGVSRVYRYLAWLTSVFGTRWSDRPIQLNRRFTIPDPSRVPKWEWYQEYRRYSGNRVTELCKEFKQTGHNAIPRVDYLREMGRSQIAFSPFGWGEVCFRDFEAVATGAVLVKPDMSHLETYPDLYEDRETYVAVRWDLADLPEACQWLLDHPQDAQRIANEARRRLLGYLDKGQFDNQLRSILSRLPKDGGRTLRSSSGR